MGQIEIPILVSLMLIATTLPMILSVAIAILPSSKPKNVNDYFLYEEQLDANGFMKSSVGYSLQAAAIFLFIYWVFTYGYSSLFVPLAWFSGYWLQYYMVKKGCFDRFLKSNKSQTIHSFVGESIESEHLKSVLVLVISLSTIFGIGGTMFTEADYVVQWLTESLSIDAHMIETVQSVGLYFVVVFALIYVLWGGYKAVVKTDVIQVPLAYLSFGLFIIISAYLALKQGNSVWGLGSLLVFGLIMIALMAARHFLLYKPDKFRFLNTPVFLILAISSLVAIFSFIIGGGDFKSLTMVSPFPAKTGLRWGFGWLGVLSLLTANFLWQLIDISSFQRLQSVGKEIINPEQNKTLILRAILASGIESAVAWGLIILSAVPLLILGASNPLNVAASFLSSGWLGYAAIILFLFSLSTFALSTIDAFVSAMSYVVYYDIMKLEAQGQNESDLTITTKAKLVTVGTALAVLIGYLILRNSVESEVMPQILYAIYALQISIFPVVITAILFNKVDAFAGIISVLTGWFFAYICATNSPSLGIPDHSWYVIPTLAALLTSSLAYVVISQFCNLIKPR